MMRGVRLVRLVGRVRRVARVRPVRLVLFDWLFVALVGCVGPPRVGGVAELMSPVPLVRRRAAASLGAMGDKAAVPALVRALDDSDASVRAEAARSLGLLRDERAVPALCRALADPDVDVRFYAAYALGEIRDRRAADPLLEALADPEWCVRDQAAWALRELHDPSLAPRLVRLLADAKADAAHIEWLVRQMPPETVVGPLADLLRSGNETARLRAARCLARIEDEAVVPHLLAALRDRSPGVRRLAVGALAERTDERAKAAIEKMLAAEKDPGVAEAAEAALRKLARLGGLVAYWGFDDGTARDLTDGGADGEIIGCKVVEGKVGRALRFAKGAYVELGRPESIPIAQTPLTIMAWARPEAPTGVVVARGGAFCGFSLYLKDRVPKFGIHRVQDGPAYIAAATKPIPLGQWVHLAGVVKERSIELYVNGKLAATAKTPGYIPGNCGQGMEIGFDTGNSPAELTDPFVGVIDEVKVFAKALGEAELAKEIRAAQEKR